MLALWALLGCSPNEPPPPNLLLFVVDTLRADAVGPYRTDPSRPSDTPHVDRLAREGILFEEAYSTSSWTRPAMASLLTGLQPRRHGVESRRASLEPAIPTLAEWLTTAGYDTALVTANPQIGSFFGLTRGFGASFELYGRRSAGPVAGTELIARGEEVASRSIAWLETARRPFALVALAVDPHAPYAPREMDPSRAGDARERYQAEVRAADAALGEILGVLERRGELARTVILFTSDHGEEFGEYGRQGHGASLVDEGIRIPLVLRLPRSPGRAGVRVREPVQLTDVAPTLLALAGITVDEELDGSDLLAPRAPGTAVRASLVTPQGRLRAARAFPWKLVLGPDPGDRTLYDLRTGERTGVDLALTPGAAEAEARLFAAIADAAAASEPARAPRLPADLQAALEALGYVSQDDTSSAAPDVDGKAGGAERSRF
ncbi:MAG: sulfatase [Myxococcales bacterium]|nr:sulfatase [Myxococcales bacterium]